MLQNHHCTRLNIENRLGIFTENVDSSLVVVANSCVCAFTLSESFREVKTESVKFVLIQKIAQALLNVFPHHRIFVVPVVENGIRMRSHFVEPRIIGCGLVLF